MKQFFSFCFKNLRFLFSVVFVLLVTQSSWAQAVADQEAFYIYRNDGEFNGFFYEDIVRISYSKVDVDGVEKPNYVVQEVETKDSLYRIPLSVIDSVGFEQPEIKMVNNFYDLNKDDCPYRGMMEFTSPYEFKWDYIYGPSEEDPNIWVVQQKYIPKVGDILYYSYWWGNDFFENGPFVGKVVEVIDDPDALVNPDHPEYGYDNGIVRCEPITDLSEVFDQLVTVERIEKEDDSYYSRMAGQKGMKPQWDGNKALNLISLNGRFSTTYDGGKWNANFGIDVNLEIKANVSYNIGRGNTYVNVQFKEKAEVGTSFSLQGVLEDVLVLPLAGVPIGIPAMLPIFELNPTPGAFIKSSGTINATISSPKFGYEGTQNVVLKDGGVSGSCSNTFKDGSESDNNWGLELSLDGSLQAGANFPFKFQTNSWVKKALFASIGVDVFVGPKFDAHFSLTPAALAKEPDVYAAFKNTNINFSPMASVYEANALVSAGSSEKKVKFFDGEKRYLNQTLTLFPEFEKTEHIRTIEWGYEDGFYSTFRDYWEEEVHVKPRGNSVPFYVGMGVANADKKLLYVDYKDESHGNEWRMYSFFQTFDDMKFHTKLLDGSYYLMPVIKVFDMDVPVWESAAIVSVDRKIFVTNNDYQYSKGEIVIDGLINTDEITIEQISGSGLVKFGEEVRENHGSYAGLDIDLDLGSEHVCRSRIPFTNQFSMEEFGGREPVQYRIKAVRGSRVRYSDPFGFMGYTWERK